MGSGEFSASLKDGMMMLPSIGLDVTKNRLLQYLNYVLESQDVEWKRRKFGDVKAFGVKVTLLNTIRRLWYR